MNTNLFNILKDVIQKNGEDVLSEPKRVYSFFADLARDEPKPIKNAFIKCLENGYAKILSEIEEAEIDQCKQRLVKKLHDEEGFATEICEEALELLKNVLVIAKAPKQEEVLKKNEKAEKVNIYKVIFIGFNKGCKTTVTNEIRTIANVSLKDAKNIVENPQSVIVENITAKRASVVKKLIISAGGNVEIQPEIITGVKKTETSPQETNADKSDKTKCEVCLYYSRLKNKCNYYNKPISESINICSFDAAMLQASYKTQQADFLVPSRCNECYMADLVQNKCSNYNKTLSESINICLDKKLGKTKGGLIVGVLGLIITISIAVSYYNLNVTLQRNHNNLQENINISNSLIITSLRVGNASGGNPNTWINSPGQTLTSNQIRELWLEITYNSNTNRDHIPLYVKIKDPRGNVVNHSNYPVGFTASTGVRIFSGNDRTAQIWVHGDLGRNQYFAGTWTVELWHRDIVLLRADKFLIN